MLSCIHIRLKRKRHRLERIQIYLSFNPSDRTEGNFTRKFVCPILQVDLKSFFACNDCMFTCHRTFRAYGIFRHRLHIPTMSRVFAPVLGPVYTKCQRQRCDKFAVMLHNGFATHFQASPLISMRIESLAASQIAVADPGGCRGGHAPLQPYTNKS